MTRRADIYSGPIASSAFPNSFMFDHNGKIGMPISMDSTLAASHRRRFLWANQRKSEEI
jgi:hypothetical protein